MPRQGEAVAIRNPIEWSVYQARVAATAVGATGADWRRLEMERDAPLPAVARINFPDLLDALSKGFADFAASRTDVMLLCVFYPVLGLVLGRIASGENTLDLLFPLVSGFALIGPLAAVGLYEMSRRRELGATVGWADAFGVLRSPSLGPILVLGLALTAVFVIWLGAAHAIYIWTLGPGYTASFSTFFRAVFSTDAGVSMIVLGMGVGFGFALVVLILGVVSFPMLIDRDVGVETALRTSVRAVMKNPVTMAIWGLIVAVALFVGSIPIFLGLVVVLPVLGHATWHLYRKLVPR
jgi:uncharacterized membrane protein